MCRWWLLLVVCSPLVAFAQDARSLFDEGSALYAKGAWKEAALKFEASWAARPLPLTKFNLARCYEAAGQTLPAIDAAQTYLLLSPGAADRAEVESSLKKLGRKLAVLGVQALTVTSLPTGARVLVDGKPRGVSPVSLEIPAGRHVLRLEQEGREAVERTLSFSLERPAVESFELPLRARPPVADAPVAAVLVPAPLSVPPQEVRVKTPPRMGVTLLVAGGLVAAAGAVGLGWSGITYGQLQQQRVDVAVPSSFVSREDFNRLGWVYPGSWVAVGVGLAAVGVGTALLISGQPVTITPLVQPGTGAVSLAGRF